MIKAREFDSQEEATIFARQMDDILDIEYKKVGYNYRTKADIYAWLVTWDESSFDEMYPAMAIEM